MSEENRFVIYVTKDGNQICVLIGENIQEGCAGFGSTLAEALIDLAEDLRSSNRDFHVNALE